MERDFEVAEVSLSYLSDVPRYLVSARMERAGILVIDLGK